MIGSGAYYFDLNIDYVPSECNYLKEGYDILIGGDFAPSWITVDRTNEPQHRIKIETSDGAYEGSYTIAIRCRLNTPTDYNYSDLYQFTVALGFNACSTVSYDA